MQDCLYWLHFYMRSIRNQSIQTLFHRCNIFFITVHPQIAIGCSSRIHGCLLYTSTITYRVILEEQQNRIFTIPYDASAELSLTQPGDRVRIDVYKRQVPAITPAIGCGVLDAAIDQNIHPCGSIPRGYISVSYTHLDVYKRQPEHRAQAKIPMAVFPRESV